MQYQHLVFEEFARKVQPQVNLFAGYETDIDPSIVAEFAHTVYRFGHSMLTETVERTNADGSTNDIGLIEAFLNPLAFTDGGAAGTLDARAGGRRDRPRHDPPARQRDRRVRHRARCATTCSACRSTSRRSTSPAAARPASRRSTRRAASSTRRRATRRSRRTRAGRTSGRHPAPRVAGQLRRGLRHAPDASRAPTTLKAKRDGGRRCSSLGGDGAPADRLDFLNGTGDWANGADGVTDDRPRRRRLLDRRPRREADAVRRPARLDLQLRLRDADGEAPGRRPLLLPGAAPRA